MDDEQFAVTTALIALTRALLAAKAVDRDLLREHLTSGRNLLVVGKQFEALDTYDYLMRIVVATLGAIQRLSVDAEDKRRPAVPDSQWRWRVSLGTVNRR